MPTGNHTELFLHFFIRLERIVALLDTGSSTAIRQTAAKQLGDIAHRFFPITDSSIEHVKKENSASTHSKHDRSKYEEGWRNSVGLVYRILPLLGSKNMETRLAAVNALNHIAEAVPLWFPEASESNPASISLGPPVDPLISSRSIETLDIEALVKSSNKLGNVAESVQDQGLAKTPLDIGGTSQDSRYLKTLGIDSTLISQNESLSDVDVDDEIGEDVNMEIGSSGKRNAGPSKRATGRSSVKVGSEEGPSRKKVKLESKPKASQGLGDSNLDAAECSSQVRRPGRPKGSKSKTQSPSFPSSPSGKTSDGAANQDDMFQGLSGRQVMVLKRKLRMNSITTEQAAEEAMRYVSRNSAWRSLTKSVYSLPTGCDWVGNPQAPLLHRARFSCPDAV